jgi:hypothetical protein
MYGHINCSCDCTQAPDHHALTPTGCAPQRPCCWGSSQSCRRAHLKAAGMTARPTWARGGKAVQQHGSHRTATPTLTPAAGCRVLLRHAFKTASHPRAKHHVCFLFCCSEHTLFGCGPAGRPLTQSPLHEVISGHGLEASAPAAIILSVPLKCHPLVAVTKLALTGSHLLDIWTTNEAASAAVLRTTNGRADSQKAQWAALTTAAHYPRGIKRGCGCALNATSTRTCIHPATSPGGGHTHPHGA